MHGSCTKAIMIDVEQGAFSLSRHVQSCKAKSSGYITQLVKSEE
jgi:hypothetical protein